MLILAIGAFQLATIRDGHDWGADFAQYVQHARNLVEGRPYAATGYVYNPATAATGPRAYPPVFPLLLTPVVAATWPELNLTAMKIECIAFLLVALVLIERTLRPIASPRIRYAAVGLLGFNPWLWDFKDQVLSDLPFLAFVYATLALAQRLERPDASARARAATAAAVGLAAFVATATRTVGITLMAALALAELVRERRITRSLVIAAVVYGVGFAIQSRILPPEASYTDQLRNDPMIVVRNLDVYARALSVVWANGYWLVPRAALTGLTIVLAFVGWAARVRRGVSIAEAFLVPYLGIVLAWPSEQGTRFLLPILPLLFAYALVALERAHRALPALFVAAALASYGARYTTLDFGPLTSGVSTASARELFAFLRSRTAPDDVIAFRKARAISLFTGRPAVVPHVASDDELAAYLRSVRVRWVVDGLDEENRLGGIVSRHPEWFQLTFRNAEFRAYRFNG
ncbi:MAG: hypothetical protein U0610_00920 [bacterium]